VFLDIKKAFDTTWHSALLYKLSKSEFSAKLIQLIGFISERKFRVSGEGEMSTPREMEAGVPQGSVLSPTPFTMHINDAPPNRRSPFNPLCRRHLSICKEGFIFRKLQRGLSLMEAWCERWNIKLNEDKTQAIYFSCRLCLILL
jgi:hypothetical protein